MTERVSANHGGLFLASDLHAIAGVNTDHRVRGSARSPGDDRNPILAKRRHGVFSIFRKQTSLRMALLADLE
jgi:hypothetical protein